MAGKYTPLGNFLKNLDPARREINLTFGKIEEIINDTLPYSARNHRAWWSNEQDGQHVNAHAWMSAGWEVDSVDFSREVVRLVRSSTRELDNWTPIDRDQIIYQINKMPAREPSVRSSNVKDDSFNKSRRRIVLISCVKTKLSYPAKAKDLYISPQFKKSLKYAYLLEPDAIFVLSAKYGMVELDQVIAPYEKTLRGMSAPAQRAWATRVLSALGKHASLNEDLFIILAGETYRKHLIPKLKHYEIPLKGLSQGQQLQELNRRLS